MRNVSDKLIEKFGKIYFIFNIIILYSINKLIEIGRRYDMEMNVEKTKVMRILRQPSTVTIMIDQKQLQNVECFKYLGSILTMMEDVCVELNLGLPW